MRRRLILMKRRRTILRRRTFKCCMGPELAILSRCTWCLQNQAMLPLLGDLPSRQQPRWTDSWWGLRAAGPQEGQHARGCLPLPVC